MDIDLYDYVQATEFFTRLNDRLSEHLRLYVQDHFYALGIAHEDLKLNVEVDFYTISAVCYIKVNRKQRDNMPAQVINCMDLSKQILDFYQFYQQIYEAEQNRNLLKLKLPAEPATSGQI
ncbi:hypothetical protein [Glaesserella sp.]|uniref:hypothetical protein n=1 Tax=Glaesserella sp. TaxID=2094731 RepID=UPI00359F8F00